MNDLCLENLIHKVNELDYHNSFIKELSLVWKTSYKDGLLHNYESPPSLFIKICLPESDIYLILEVEGVYNYNPRVLDELEVFVESYVGYYRLYINSKEEYPNSFIEFKKLNYLRVIDISESD